MPGDAAWLGTFGDWRTARTAYDQAGRTGQAWRRAIGQGMDPAGQRDKAVRQAAIIADLEPAAADKLCTAYKAKKMFCEVKKPTEIVQPFGCSGADLAALSIHAIEPP